MRGCKRSKSMVTVYPDAFRLREEDDFLSDLRYHEGRHACHLYHLPNHFTTTTSEYYKLGISTKRNRIRELIDELLCDSFQLERDAAGDGPLSAEYRRTLMVEVEEYRGALLKLIPKECWSMQPLAVLNHYCWWGEQDYKNFTYMQSQHSSPQGGRRHRNRRRGMRS